MTYFFIIIIIFFYRYCQGIQTNVGKKPSVTRCFCDFHVFFNRNKRASVCFLVPILLIKSERSKLGFGEQEDHVIVLLDC